jgi:YVTN family beta-propeller protein
VVTSKNASKLGRLTVALGLGVAVSTGHGVAAADSTDGGGTSSSNSSQSSAGSPESSAASASDAADTSSTASSAGSATESDAADSPSDNDPTAKESTGTANSGFRDATTQIVVRRDDGEAEPATPTEQPEPTSQPNPPEPTQVPPAPQTPSSDHATVSDRAQLPEVRAVAEADVTTSVVVQERSATPKAVEVEPVTNSVREPNVSARVVSVTAVAPQAPALAAPRTVLGPLTGLLAIFGLRPAVPGTPVTPIGQLVELIWVAARRVEHLLFNQAPVATSLTVNPQTVAGVITGRVNATDPDPEDHLTYTLAQGPAQGRVDLNTDGTFTYTPDAAWAHAGGGDVTFAVDVSDEGGGFHLHLFTAGHTVTVLVTLAVEKVNRAPVLGAVESTAGPTAGSIVYTVSATDPDGDPVTIVGVSSDVAKGRIVKQVDGTFLFSPDADYAHSLSATGATGAVALTFNATDGEATTSTTVTAPIAATNSAPSLAAVAAPRPDHTVVITLTASDADGDTVTVTLPVPASGTLTTADGDAAPPTLTLAVGTSATLIFVPNHVAGGSNMETLTFTAVDGHGGATTASVTATVVANQAPVFTMASTTASNGDTVITFVGSDADGDQLTLTLPDPQYGKIVYISVTGTGGASSGTSLDGFTGTKILPPGAVTGVMYYRPTSATGNPASETLTFSVSDGFGGTTSASVVAALPVNHAPEVTAIALTPQGSGDVSIMLTLNDVDRDRIEVTFPTLQYGEFVRIDITKGDGTTHQINAAGIVGALTFDAGDRLTLTYRPDRVAGQPSSETMTFVVADGNGATATATTTAIIRVPNTPPVVERVDNNLVVLDPVRGTADFRVRVSDADGDAVTVTAGNPSDTTVARNADGTYTVTWTAPAGYAHSLSRGGSLQPVGVTITVNAADALDAVTSRDVGIMINPYNRAPVVNALTVGAPLADGSVRGAVVVTDADGDAITYSGTSTKGSVTFGSGGAFTFSPSAAARATAASVNATAADKQAAITIAVDDGHGGKVTATATVDVLPAGAIVFEGAGAVDVLRLSDPTKLAVRTTNAVHIIDTSGSGTTRSVSLAGMAVQSLTVSPDGAYVYVGTYQSNSEGRAEPIVKIDTRTGVGTTIGQVQQPSAMATSADGRTVYVTNQQSGTVSAIDTVTGSTTVINTGLQTDALAVLGSKLYVGSVINDLRVWDLTQNKLTVVQTGPNGTFASTQRIAAGSGFVYVTDRDNNAVVVVNATTNTVVRTVTLPSAPTSIVTTADGAVAFVASRSAGTVSMIGTDTSSVLKSIAVGAGSTAVQLSADGATLYVVTQSRVEMYRVAELYPTRV